MLDDKLYDKFTTEAFYLPNIHSYQYDDYENNTQYVLMTKTQFYHNLFTGDGNMIADVVLFHPESFDNGIFLCSGYKTIKGYLGVAKRDLKLHGDDSKKRFHAKRSLMTAEALMKGERIDVNLFKDVFDNKEKLNVRKLFNEEKRLRTKLNEMLDNEEISLYPRFDEENRVLQIMYEANNVKEFKY